MLFLSIFSIPFQQPEIYKITFRESNILSKLQTGFYNLVNRHPVNKVTMTVSLLLPKPSSNFHEIFGVMNACLHNSVYSVLIIISFLFIEIVLFNHDAFHNYAQSQ